MRIECRVPSVPYPGEAGAGDAHRLRQQWDQRYAQLGAVWIHLHIAVGEAVKQSSRLRDFLAHPDRSAQHRCLVRCDVLAAGITAGKTEIEFRISQQAWIAVGDQRDLLERAVGGLQRQ